MITYQQNAPQSAAELAELSRKLAEQAQRLAAEEARQQSLERKDVRRLTEREEQVVNLVSRGLTNKEVAQVVQVSEATIKIHAKAAMRKLNCRNRTELALCWYGIDPSVMRPEEVREAIQ